MNTKRVVTVALLIALEIVLVRFLSIQTPITRISLGFIPAVMIAIMYGPIYAGVAGAISDILGYMIFPTASFFPGFTLTAFVSGYLYGFFLYKKPKSLLRISIAMIVVTIVSSFILNTLWLYIMMGPAFVGLIATRYTAAIIQVPLKIIVIRFLTSEKCIRVIGSLRGA